MAHRFFFRAGLASWAVGLMMCSTGLALGAPAADPPTLLWARQLGTSNADASNDVAVDASGNAYITGSTWGPSASPGRSDAFLSRYDTAGNLRAGPSSSDPAIPIAATASPWTPRATSTSPAPPKAASAAPTPESMTHSSPSSGTSPNPQR